MERVTRSVFFCLTMQTPLVKWKEMLNGRKQFLHIVYQNFTDYHHGELLSSGTELKAGMSIHRHFKITRVIAIYRDVCFGKISNVHSVGIKTV